jgi:hypothetical protein
MLVHILAAVTEMKQDDLCRLRTYNNVLKQGINRIQETSTESRPSPGDKNYQVCSYSAIGWMHKNCGNVIARLSSKEKIILGLK